MRGLSREERARGVFGRLVRARRGPCDSVLLLSAQMVEDGPLGDAERKAEEVSHCPLCFKEFVCKYGLETHLETHSDNPLR